MDIKLIHGQFSKSEAIDLITKLIHIKIKFHEEKINQSDNEEDIKMREKRIKELQKELFEARKSIEQRDENVNLNGEIFITK